MPGNIKSERRRAHLNILLDVFEDSGACLTSWCVEICLLAIYMLVHGCIDRFIVIIALKLKMCFIIIQFFYSCSNTYLLGLHKKCYCICDSDSYRMSFMTLSSLFCCRIREPACPEALVALSHSDRLASYITPFCSFILPSSKF